jgi:transposase
MRANSGKRGISLPGSVWFSTKLHRRQDDFARVSKRGNPYIRRLLIHGARSCMIHLDRSRDRMGAWLNALDKRMHWNKAIVALANKIARNCVGPPQAAPDSSIAPAYA